MKIALIGAVALIIVLGALFVLTGGMNDFGGYAKSSTPQESPAGVSPTPTNPSTQQNDPFSSLKTN